MRTTTTHNRGFTNMRALSACRTMPTKRVSVDLPIDLYKRLKLLCFTEDLKMGDTIRNCVEKFCDEKESHMITIVDRRSRSH